MNISGSSFEKQAFFVTISSMQEKTESNKKTVSEREEEILRSWQDNKIFEKSLELRRGGELFTFYDGPPFATGKPHYGHMPSSFLKDVIPRYQTMRGKYVPRRWGWDCHGLPLENIIEQELGLAHKKDIEQYGIAKFNAEAERAVLRFADAWKQFIPRIGRWVDMENDYRTMDPTYTESVWWVFKTLHEKGLIYEGYKSMHICPRCETTLANFEVSQGYKDITDISVTVKFELADEPGTFVLAWTTTPWTLPGNVALAVNPDIEYVIAESNSSLKRGITDGELSLETGRYIFAADRFSSIVKEGNYFSDNIKKIKGSELVGKKYKPPFDYYSKDEKLENRENGWKIYAADFVSTQEGTGVVHIAPAFGEDDMRLGKEHNLPFIQHVSMDGTFKKEVGDNLAGFSVKPKDDHQKTDIEILKLLHARGALFSKQKITHSYPFCWRCDTPLLNYAASSWFVNVSGKRGDLKKTNQEITWIPPHLKDGRFGKGLETAPDWAISRTRFWGAPLPVWKCGACKEQFVAGSLKDLETRRTRKPNTFILMRHGEREDISREKDNPKEYDPVVISSKPDVNIHVSENGKARVRAVAEELAKEGGIDLIFSSDFIRTRETSEIVSEALGGAPVVYDVHLRELNHGDEFEGRTVADYRAFFSSPEERFTKKPEGGETLRDVRARMMQALREIDATHEGKRVLVISHGDPLWILECALKNMSEKESVVYRETNYMKQGETRRVEFKNYPYGEDGRLNMHRPYIDDVALRCECGGEMKRILEVFDCWFESGSMPYGQHHYPFDSFDKTPDKSAEGRQGTEFDPARDVGFPADFIAEGLDQTRGWFYSLHVLATNLFGKPAYKHVVVNGIILAEDGQKMSKRLKNYPDPMDVIATYGADALRLYILSSPVVYAQDMNFSEKGVGEVYKKVILRLLNIVSFYEQYAGSDDTAKVSFDDSLHALDKFILVELQNAKEAVEKALDEYQPQRASRAVADFIDVLSTVYLQYSRDRFKEDDPRHHQARGVLRYVLAHVAKLSAPLIPFLAERVYGSVKFADAAESVHLEDWPTVDVAIALFEEDAKEVAKIPEIVEAILAERSNAGIPVRQPLRLSKVAHLPKNDECHEVIRARVNVESLEEDTSLPAVHPAWIDREITPELREKGMLREFTRGVQEARKIAGLKSRDHIILEVYSEGGIMKDFFKRYQEEIAHAVHADSVVCVEEPGDHEIDLDECKVFISLIHT